MPDWQGDLWDVYALWDVYVRIGTGLQNNSGCVSNSGLRHSHLPIDWVSCRTNYLYMDRMSTGKAKGHQLFNRDFLHVLALADDVETGLEAICRGVYAHAVDGEDFHRSIEVDLIADDI